MANTLVRRTAKNKVAPVKYTIARDKLISLDDPRFSQTRKPRGKRRGKTDPKLTVPLRVKLLGAMVRLHPQILHSLFLLGRLTLRGDFDHPLDGVYEEDCYEAAIRDNGDKSV